MTHAPRPLVFICETEDGKLTAHGTRESARAELAQRSGPGRVREMVLRDPQPWPVEVKRGDGNG